VEQAESVSSARRGRERLYTFKPEPLDRAAWIASLEACWETRLASLQRVLNEEANEAAGGINRGRSADFSSS
jgi:hypothetical protein